MGRDSPSNIGAGTVYLPSRIQSAKSSRLGRYNDEAREKNFQEDGWILTSHMLASAVLLRRSCTSRVGTKLGTSSEILLVCCQLCPPHLGETSVFVPLIACHARMPLHLMYDAGLVFAVTTGHDGLSFPSPVDLARVAARSTTGPEAGHLGHSFAVREVVVSCHVC